MSRSTSRLNSHLPSMLTDPGRLRMPDDAASRANGGHRAPAVATFRDMARGDLQLMRSKVAPLMLAELERRGVDPRPIARRFSLPDDTGRQREVWLSMRALNAVCDACAEAAGERLLGFRTGLTLPRGRYGLVEFAARSAPTLRGVLERLLEYSSLISELVAFELVRFGRDEVLYHGVPGEPLGFGAQVNEFFLGFAVHMVRQLVGEDFTPQQAWLAHPSTGVAVFEKALGCRVSAGAGRNGIAFGRADLERPILTSDPALLEVLDDQALHAARSRPHLLDLASQVREQAQGLLHQADAMELVAARLRMSARTLQRRLQSSGTTFSTVVDQVRRGLALQLIADESIALGEIAYQLGYHDVRSFQRAYKRWMGTTPSAARDST